MRPENPSRRAVLRLSAAFITLSTLEACANPAIASPNDVALKLNTWRTTLDSISPEYITSDITKNGKKTVELKNKNGVEIKYIEENNALIYIEYVKSTTSLPDLRVVFVQTPSKDWNITRYDTPVTKNYNQWRTDYYSTNQKTNETILNKNTFEGLAKNGDQYLATFTNN